MKIAVLGDAHLVSDSDPYKPLHDRRAFFISCWPSFQDLLKKVNSESPDLTIFLGDLFDWFSPENIAFGLDLLSDLRSPWHMTPGNHDLAAPIGGSDQETYSMEASRERLAYWAEQGVDVSNRVLDIDGCRLILLDSALSDLVDGADAWLGQMLMRSDSDMLFTHVPIYLPETRDYILSVDSRRNMAKYVLSGAPELYAQQIKNRVPHVFTAHLHFPGDLHCDTTRFHLCNMSITMYDPHRDQSATASATMIESTQDTFAFRKITVAKREA